MKQLVALMALLLGTSIYAQDSNLEIIQRSNKILSGESINGATAGKSDPPDYAKTILPQIDSRIQALKSGTVKVDSLRDAEIKFDALDPSNVIHSPKVKPDGKNYTLNGYLEKFTDASFIASSVPLMVIGSFPVNPRFVVLVPSSLQSKYQNTARVGGKLALIGKYVGNRNVVLVTGASVTVPIFEMIYLE